MTPAGRGIDRKGQVTLTFDRFTIEGRLGNIIYFDDIQTGLIAVIMSLSPSETKMVRFAGRRMLRSGPPSAN